MNEPTETQQAEKFLKQGVKLILAVTIIGTALLIYYGEPVELWASLDTIQDSSWDVAESKPSLTISAGDP